MSVSNNGRPGGEGQSRTARMHAAEESDRGLVPMKQPNNKGEARWEQPEAEAVEGSPLAKENAAQPNAGRTQSRETVSSGLSRVRQAAREGKHKQFTALLHHLTVDLLRESYYALKRAAAPGVDGVRWEEYEAGLEERLEELHSQVHRGAYRAQPSRRVYIPKADGRQRPLGIAALEDKIVQQAVAAILNQMYEEEFLGFSYGFRPKRHPHQALDALSVGLTRKKVNWVLDADIRGFFDNIDHEWMGKFLQHRIADTRVLRLIQKWLRAGVSQEGQWSETKVGTPQGAVISPLLANVYLHYVFDLWVEAWRNKCARGDVIVIRYADDFVLGFEQRAEAERFLGQLRERLAKFGLELHPEKTRLIEFGRFAASNRNERGMGKPETFDFLGFTHICGKNRKTGYFEVRRKTVGKRLARKLQEIKQQLRRRMHEPPAQTGEWLRSVVQGYFNYHAIPGNRRRLCAFRSGVVRQWRSVLARRSQKARLRWARMTQLVRCYIPTARLVHPFPSVRFDAMHPR